jgi:hypothetical protein
MSFALSRALARLAALPDYAPTGLKGSILFHGDVFPDLRLDRRLWVAVPAGQPAGFTGVDEDQNPVVVPAVQLLHDDSLQVGMKLETLAIQHREGRAAEAKVTAQELHDLVQVSAERAKVRAREIAAEGLEQAKAAAAEAQRLADEAAADLQQKTAAAGL